MISKIKKFQLFVFLLSFYSLVLVPFVKAEEIIVTDNGADSANEVTVNQASDTNVTQTNEAEVANNVQTDSNTGENSVSGNTASDVSVETGSSTTQVSIETTANSSVTDLNSCCTETGTDTIAVTGNGSGSQNTVDTAIVTQTTADINQTATIRNNIIGVANTGDNSASDNTGGDVSISTGQVRVLTGITNGPINFSLVNISSPAQNSNAEISGNGADSINFLKANFFYSPKVNIENSASIDNYIFWDLNSGRNNADRNTGGSVSITTGDTDLSLFINNFLNLSDVTIGGCCEENEDPGDDETPTDDEDNGSEENEDSDNDSDEDEGRGGSDPGSEVGMGGPGILGLSDTSGRQLQAIIFWISLAMIGLGGKIVADGYKEQNFTKK